jgi:hypothetical protein
MAAPGLAFLHDGPAEPEATLVLAHGAGAPMDSPFMGWWAAALGERGIHVVRFEFPYMRQRRASGGRRPPDREPVLLNAWREAAGCWPGAAIGGKSMGGRIASMVADEVGAPALVCLGYPFHPPGKPAAPRISHLQALAAPALIVQGTNDPFGRREEVEGYRLAAGIRFAWVEGGNHDLAQRGRPPEAAWQSVVDLVADFLARHSGAAR